MLLPVKKRRPGERGRRAKCGPTVYINLLLIASCLQSVRHHTKFRMTSICNKMQYIAFTDKHGAGTRIRTTDFLITNEALYQLSYTGISGLIFSLFRQF